MIRTFTMIAAAGIAMILFVFGMKEIKVSPHKRKSFFLTTLLLALSLLNVRGNAKAQDQEAVAGTAVSAIEQSPVEINDALFNSVEWGNFKSFWKKLDALAAETKIKKEEAQKSGVKAKEDAEKKEREDAEKKEREDAEKKEGLLGKVKDFLDSKFDRNKGRHYAEFEGLDSTKEYGGAISEDLELDLIQELRPVIESLGKHEGSGLLNQADLMVLDNLCRERITRMAFSEEKHAIEMRYARYEPYYLKIPYGSESYERKKYGLEDVEQFIDELEQKIAALNSLRKRGLIDEDDYHQAGQNLGSDLEMMLVLEFWNDYFNYREEYLPQVEEEFQSVTECCEKGEERCVGTQCSQCDEKYCGPTKRNLAKKLSALEKVIYRRSRMETDYRNVPILLQELLK